MIKKLLIIISKTFHIDAEYFIKNFSFLSLVNVVSLIGGFLAAIFFARLVSQELYGKYQLILTFYIGFAGLSLLGMRPAVTQAVSRGYEKTYREGLKISAYYCFIGVIGLLLLSFYYIFEKRELDMGYLFIFSAITFIPYTLSSFYSTYLAGKKEFNKSSKYTASMLLISNIVLLASIYFKPYLNYLIYAYIVPQMIIGMFLTLKIYRSSLEGDIDKQNIQFGKSLSVIYAIVNVAFYYDKVITGIFIGFKELALYKFAEVMPEQIKGLIKNLQVIALPKLAVMNKVQIRENFIKKLAQLLCITSIVVLAYILIAKHLFLLFFPSYIQSVVYSYILALSLIPLSGSILCNSLFEAQKMTKALAWMHYSFSIMQIFFVSVLSFQFGILGLIIANFLVRLFVFFIGLYLSYKI